MTTTKNEVKATGKSLKLCAPHILFPLVYESLGSVDLTVTQRKHTFLQQKAKTTQQEVSQSTCC
jgi:hypothetical protein